TGGLMANWIGLARAMARLPSASAYTEFHQTSTRTYDPYMPIVVWGAFLGGVALAVFSSGLSSASGQLAVAGFFCYAAVIAISLATGVRIDKLIANWSAHAPPEEWAPIRARWIRFHIVRTLFSVLGLVTYLLSGMLVS
ncbi:MAG TPA: anthrone oxygenase family protein, partial [Stellaceae bacterium]|nr:anthrone oxygenase family protein [Stellaceae bacterium]